MGRMNDGQTKTLMVVHIPKAAGTTLRVIMERQYPAPRIFKIVIGIQQERRNLAALAPEEKRKLAAVFGHMCWGWHEELAEGQEYQYLTVLREPTERVLSLYAYCKLPRHYLKDAIKGMDLAEFVTSGVTSVCDNGMVRQLCGADRFMQNPGQDMLIPFGEVTSEHLEAAKRNLDACAIVGIAEDFDAMLSVCQAQLGWRIPAYENQNVTHWTRPKREEQDQATLGAIEAHNELDRELYEYVKGGR